MLLEGFMLILIMIVGLGALGLIGGFFADMLKEAWFCFKRR